MHLTDEQLNEYLDHETNDHAQIETHLTSCSDCSARLAALQDLFVEIESLPELELSRPVAAGQPAALPHSLALTITLQAVLAVASIIVAAPFVTEFVSASLTNFPAPSLAGLFLQLQAYWTLWLDTLSTFRIPSIPEIPIVDVSSLFTMFTVVGVSLLWLIGNGLLLRNQNK